MKILKAKQLVFIATLSLAQAQTFTRNLAQESSSTTSTVIFIVLLMVIAAFLVYDNRQDYRYLFTIRMFIRQRWMIVRDYYVEWRKRKAENKENVEALDGQQSSKSTFTALEHEKTFVDTDRKSMQETISSPSMPEDCGNLTLEDDTPQVNLKDVFGPDKKQKGKGKDKKSKSKLRGKVQIKKSELEADEQEEPSNDFSQPLEEDPREQVTQQSEV